MKRVGIDAMPGAIESLKRGKEPERKAFKREEGTF